MGRTSRTLLHTLIAAALLALLSACSGSEGSDGGPGPRSFPRYFAFDGTQQFVASRNIYGRTVQEVNSLLDKARDEGTTLVRFHVTWAFGPWITTTGGVVESWAASWDEVFTHAEANGIHVLPVFGAWADWNDGSNDEGWHIWHENPLNSANGGPASSPARLFESGSAVQRAWIGWLRALAERWQAHDNVAAWEIFSELDLVSHKSGEASFRDSALAFVRTAASALREADPQGRPITAALSFWPRWPSLYASDAIDVVQVHLYGPDANLYSQILEAAATLREYGKPMLLGESGLDWHAPDGATATTAVEGPLATQHAVWAALVSGFMNGRSLWWEDGYAVQAYGDASVPFVTGYPDVERGVLTFLDGRDLSGMRVIPWYRAERFDGGVIANDEGTALGWVHHVPCAFPHGIQPPDCEVLPGNQIGVEAPGSATSWEAMFHDPRTGATIGEPVVAVVPPNNTAVVIELPAFADDVAFTLTPLP